MAELWFVGAGLGDERDLSRRAIDVLRSADRVFAEEYTSLLAEGTLDRIEAEIGRPVERLTRVELEAESAVLTALASVDRVALLVTGDPFVATTHVQIRLAAEGAGHRWQYLPGPSILTAAASLLGLMHYRFGRVVSLPFADPGFDPVSPFESVGRNRAAGAHTLLLLDLRASEGRYLTASEALARFEGAAAGAARVDAETEFGVVARVGRADSSAWWGTKATLAGVEFGPPLHTVVVPAPELHFAETEAVARWRPNRTR
ncbi:MAG TPA: diphthine synthase [Thermoplasmata archaeon]|nr:diphthine synthase [Thermoplasmata archaeon]